MAEDGTAIAHVLASVIAATNTVALFKRDLAAFGYLYLLLSIGLLLVAGDELSWGQRAFNGSTPEWIMSWNYQDETTFHNIVDEGYLAAFYLLVGFYGAFSRLLVPKSLKVQYWLATGLLTPDWYLVLYFFFAFALCLYYSCFLWWFGPVFGDEA